MTSFRWVFLVAFFALLDQVTKYWVVATLPLQEPVDILPLLAFYRTYNEGIAFSFLSWVNDWVQVGFILMVVAFVLWLWRSLDPGRWLSGLGYALITGGAIGNLIDRIMLGKVVDFILVYTESWSFAIFNLADTFVTLGAVAIILDEIRHAKRQSPSHSKSPENDI